jgi:hypothetical protein
MAEDPTFTEADLDRDQYRVRNGRVEYYDPDMFGNIVKYSLLGLGAGVGGYGLATGLAGGGTALAAGGTPTVTTGVPAGLGSVGATGVGAGTSPWISALTNAGINAAKTKATGGSWTDTLLSAGTGAATGGFGAGGSMSWVDLLKDPDTYAAIAQVAGQAAGGRSDQRIQESQATNSSNLADLALYSAAQNAQNQAGQLDLNRKGFTEQARGGRAKQALLADLLSNMQDVNINVPGVTPANVTGGLRPSAIGASGRGSLAELSKQALQAQLAGDKFEGGSILPTPQYKAMPEQGGVEKTLDWIGLLGGLAGALQKTQQPTGTSTLPGATGIRPTGLR